MSPEQTAFPLPRPEALLFDWDGTLVDSHPVLAAAMNQTLEAYGREPWTYDQWEAWLGLSARDAFPKEFGDDWQEARLIYLEAYGKLHLDRLQLLAGAEELIAALSAKSVPLAVVSNKTGHYLRSEAAHFGWQGIFQSFVGSGDSAHDKPAADPVYNAMRPMGIQPSPNTWFIGDNDVDVACGRAAGCTTILVGDGYPDSDPDQRVNDLVALRNLILGRLDSP
ncbi:MAG: HAD hydrolase-like protein [Rhodospirillaceae bacterium]|jgi:phosphoglycolate phosphatase|nr:HAD hydrolase-like protein [Rhodospirillaceae bacterium]MBT6089341.1 HAD hydrolase-like protein [Rhodospirillaceae bacterium]MBT7451740.1 HAD hydrolase-like protein [Rhodospirillaceae bacterium]